MIFNYKSIYAGMTIKLLMVIFFAPFALNAASRGHF